MALDFTYAPKFAPLPLAGGGGDDRPPVTGASVATGGHSQPSAKPVKVERAKPVAPSERQLHPRIRYAWHRMAEERARFAAELAAFNATIAAESEPEPAAPVVPRSEYDRSRLCDCSCRESV